MNSRAAASFDEAFNRKVAASGRILVNQLAILVKVAQMHDLKNEAVVKAADALVSTINSFVAERAGFSLLLIGEYLFIEEIRVKYNVEDSNNFDLLVNEFKKRMLGSLKFDAPVDNAGLMLFVSLFLSADTASEEVYNVLARRMGESGLEGISAGELKPPKASGSFVKVTDSRTAATTAYIRVVLRVKELYEGIGQGSPADIRKLKRAVQSLVDSVYKAEPALLRLSAVRKKEDLMPRHFTNVCVLSLCIGKRLGLSTYQMSRLGMAALLHDIGRQALPQVTGEGEELDYSALEVLKKHPRMGVETLLRLKGLNEVAVSAMIVAYEHHRNLDDSGYPEAVEPKQMNIYSKIVRIADNFDAVTSSGIYGSITVPPDKAIAIMRARTGSYYDSELFELFLRVTGTYPVGTFVLLSDGSTGVVTTSGRTGDGFDRPFVNLISGSAKGEEVDLTEKDGKGHYKWNIAGTLDPDRYGVNIYRHLI